MMIRTMLLLALGAGISMAAEATVELHATSESGTGAPVGTVHLKDTPHGLLLTPALTGLPPGLHGFHVHEHADCSAAHKDGKPSPGEAAGGHFDPGKTGKHLGPYAGGHLGDLPALHVGADGKAALPVLAPRLKLAQLRGRALMVHAGGDTYSDTPEKLGGGGARIACGPIAAPEERRPRGRGRGRGR